MGAIFEDGGINEVVRVYKHLLSPLVIFIAKFGKDCYKEPKEQFVFQSMSEFRLKPKFHISEKASVMEVTSRMINADVPITMAKMYKAEVIFRKTEVMCISFGNSRR